MHSFATKVISGKSFDTRYHWFNLTDSTSSSIVTWRVCTKRRRSSYNVVHVVASLSTDVCRNYHLWNSAIVQYPFIVLLN